MDIVLLKADFPDELADCEAGEQITITGTAKTSSDEAVTLTVDAIEVVSPPAEEEVEEEQTPMKRIVAKKKVVVVSASPIERIKSRRAEVY